MNKGLEALKIIENQHVADWNGVCYVGCFGKELFEDEIEIIKQDLYKLDKIREITSKEYNNFIYERLGIKEIRIDKILEVLDNE